MKKLLITFAIAAMVFVAGCGPKEQAPTPTPSPTPTAATTPTPEPTPAPTILATTEDMGQEYLDSIIFYGDSNTNGMRAYGVLSGGKDTTQIWTPTSGSLTLCFWKDTPIAEPETWEEILVTDMMTKHKPEYLVINLGLNGISFMGQEAFIKDYTEMVLALQAANPDTKIMLSSIYPVAHSYGHPEEINNDKITAANQWILSVAESTGCRYIDSASALVGEDGWLPEAAHNGDGLHLTAESYNKVLDYVRTHGYQ